MIQNNYEFDFYINLSRSKQTRISKGVYSITFVAPTHLYRYIYYRKQRINENKRK